MLDYPRMNYDKFKNQLGSWSAELKDFIISEECNRIYNFLKERSGKGFSICPLSENTFRAFKECPIEDLKCIIVTMDPYPWFKEGVIVADGIPMSCANNSTRQPSLELFYDGMEDDLSGGLDLNMERPNDLSYLSNRGVLLLNSSLTTELNVVGAHKSLWYPFHKFLFENVISKKDVPIVLLGNQAKDIKPYISLKHEIIEAEHPAAGAWSKRPWKHENMFSEVNNILSKKGESIEWIKKVNQ